MIAKGLRSQSSLINILKFAGIIVSATIPYNAKTKIYCENNRTQPQYTYNVATASRGVVHIQYLACLDAAGQSDSVTLVNRQ